MLSDFSALSESVKLELATDALPIGEDVLYYQFIIVVVLFKRAPYLDRDLLSALSTLLEFLEWVTRNRDPGGVELGDVLYILSESFMLFTTTVQIVIILYS